LKEFETNIYQNSEDIKKLIENYKLCDSELIILKGETFDNKDSLKSLQVLLEEHYDNNVNDINTLESDQVIIKDKVKEIDDKLNSFQELVNMKINELSINITSTKNTTSIGNIFRKDTLSDDNNISEVKNELMSTMNKKFNEIKIHIENRNLETKMEINKIIETSNQKNNNFDMFNDTPINNPKNISMDNMNIESKISIINNNTNMNSNPNNDNINDKGHNSPVNKSQAIQLNKIGYEINDSFFENNFPMKDIKNEFIKIKNDCIYHDQKIKELENAINILKKRERYDKVYMKIPKKDNNDSKDYEIETKYMNLTQGYNQEFKFETIDLQGKQYNIEKKLRPIKSLDSRMNIKIKKENERNNTIITILEKKNKSMITNKSNIKYSDVSRHDLTFLPDYEISEDRVVNDIKYNIKPKD